MTSFEGNDNNKPSSKVLRPPGGGTSDIFGSDMPQTPRALVKNHMQSSIFSTEKDHVKNSGDHPRRAQKNLDSYQRLFGEPERPMTPAKNHMKSNIPFGSTTAEAAQALIANGNGHYNGKSGSVSSASSSVSSSTENLKINGHSKTEPDEMCPPPVSSSTSPRTEKSEASTIEVNCEEKKTLDSARSKISERPDIGAVHESSQTRRDSGCNPDNPNSLTTASETHGREEPLEACVDKPPKPATPRNPITGLGLGNDGVGGLKPKKPKSRRDGNPVTGEGYKTNDFNNHTPSMNGANQIINKNRIPPGGYSSGLW